MVHPIIYCNSIPHYCTFSFVLLFLYSI